MITKRFSVPIHGLHLHPCTDLLICILQSWCVFLHILPLNRAPTTTNMHSPSTGSHVENVLHAVDALSLSLSLSLSLCLSLWGMSAVKCWCFVPPPSMSLDRQAFPQMLGPLWPAAWIHLASTFLLLSREDTQGSGRVLGGRVPIWGGGFFTLVFILVCHRYLFHRFPPFTHTRWVGGVFAPAVESLLPPCDGAWDWQVATRFQRSTPSRV